MADFPESKRPNSKRPRPTQAQLTRLSDREFNELTAKHPKRQAMGREVRCLGRMTQAEYTEHFAECFGSVLQRRSTPQKRHIKNGRGDG